MYKLHLQSGRLSKLPGDGAHSEFHLFPDERYGLEESNRVSDPSSSIRGISSQSVGTTAHVLKLSGRADARDLAERHAGRPFDCSFDSLPTTAFAGLPMSAISAAKRINLRRPATVPASSLPCKRRNRESSPENLGSMSELLRQRSRPGGSRRRCRAAKTGKLGLLYRFPGWLMGGTAEERST